jgi:hypothetical protein
MLYFDNYAVANEKLTIPSGLTFAILAKTYPVHAPTLSAVLYNPSSQMNFMMRLYAACCESKPGVFLQAASGLGLFKRRMAAAAGEPYRTLDQPVDLDRLEPADWRPPDAGGAGSK